MSVPFQTPTSPITERASNLALWIAHAENALRELTAGQVDAIIDPDGETYLLRPAQETLRRNEGHLRAIVDSAPDVITVVDRGGKIVSQNGAVTRMLGYEPGELVGQSLLELIHGDDLERVFSAFFYVIEEFHEVATVRFQHPLKLGSFRWVEATISKLRDGSAECAVFVWHPIVDEAQARPEPLASLRALSTDRFLATFLHELRTPMMPVMLGLAEMFEDERFAESRPTLEIILRNLDLHKRLIGDLVDFVSIGRHKLRLKLEVIELGEMLHFMQETCRAELLASDVTFHFDFSASSSLVLADTLRLQQILWNLLKNAIKFSPRGGKIFISVTDGPPGRLVVDIADRGVGIEPAMLLLIFDSFQQGGAPSHRAQGSLGLGLFIAKGLAEAQGATLTAHSPGRNKGASFRLTLIRAPQMEAVGVTPAQGS